MLISHQWPSTLAARKSPKPPRISKNGAIEPMLQRVQALLKSDHLVAAAIYADGRTLVVGSIGNDQSGLNHCLAGLSEPRLPCTSYNRLEGHAVTWAAAAAVQIARTQPPEGGSMLSLRVQAVATVPMVIVACRRASRSPFTDIDERALQRHAGWIADYIVLWRQLQDDEQRRTGAERALDEVGLATIMLDRDGHVIGANAAATSLLTTGDGLIAVGEALSAAVLDDAVRLHSAIGHALVGPMHDARAPVLTIRRKRHRPLVVAVLRVAADPAPGDTAIVLQIIEPDRDHASAITAACTLYGFTGAEARLARLLVNGASLAESATALHIQMPTARTYLKQAFAKSGTNRQAALVQVLLSSIVHTRAETILTTV